MNQSSELKGACVYISDGIIPGSSILSWCNGFIKGHQDSSIRAVLCHGLEVLYILIVRTSIRTLVLVLLNFKKHLFRAKTFRPLQEKIFKKLRSNFAGDDFEIFNRYFTMGGGIIFKHLENLFLQLHLIYSYYVL